MEIIVFNVQPQECGMQSKTYVFVLLLKLFGLKLIKHVTALRVYMAKTVYNVLLLNNGIKLKTYVFVQNQRLSGINHQKVVNAQLDYLD